MISLGLLKEVEDPAAITTQEVSEQLGGVEISEQGNVSKVLAAVEEASCEVGTTYLSDTIGHEDSIKILETVGYDVTGNIIYPVAQIANPDADDAESAAAADFITFITNDDAKTLYQKYGFDTDVE
jgi:molybdate transport system substrate-binding protein